MRPPARSKARAFRRKPAVKRRRTQAERRATTRRLLLDAAIESLHELGFGGATLEVISQRAGLSRGAVQFHFGNRDDLFLALIDEVKPLLAKSSALRFSKDASFADRLTFVCDHYWEVLNSRTYIAAVQVQIGTLHDPVLHPKISQILGNAEKTLDRHWVNLFRGYRIPAERLVVARHVALAALRGMAIRRVNRRKRESSARERALLIAMLRQTLQPAKAKRDVP